MGTAPEKIKIKSTIKIKTQALLRSRQPYFNGSGGTLRARLRR